MSHTDKDHAAFVRRALHETRTQQHVARAEGNQPEVDELENERNEWTKQLALHLVRRCREMQEENPNITIIAGLVSAAKELDQADSGDVAHANFVRQRLVEKSGGVLDFGKGERAELLKERDQLTQRIALLLARRAGEIQAADNKISTSSAIIAAAKELDFTE